MLGVGGDPDGRGRLIFSGWSIRAVQGCALQLEACMHTDPVLLDSLAAVSSLHSSGENKREVRLCRMP